MAPLLDPDFVGTISDNDSLPNDDDEDNLLEDTVQETQNGKRKRGQEPLNSIKKQKTQDKQEAGKNVNSDMDSEFEFALEDGTVEIDDYEALVGEGNVSSRKTVDVDALVQRLYGTEDEDQKPSDVEEDDQSELGSEGFGGAAELGEDEDEGDQSNAQSASESDADPDGYGGEGATDGENEDDGARHPNGAGSDSGSDEEEDPAEVKRRDAFFAAPPSKTPAQSSASFHDLYLSRPILKGLAALNFSHPTPIQAKTIPVALEGKDVVGGAVTGSGKTAAFLVPILERLLFRSKRAATTRVAILMPTRELALQCFNVAKKLASFTDITFGQAIGGLNIKEQEKQLRLRPDIVIGTPGRFIDLERNSASFSVQSIEILVLDEADRMLEEGFADELNEILTKISRSRQTMLFSATMTSKVDDLIRAGLQRPVRLLVDAQKSTVSGLVQEFVRLRAGRESKRLGYLMHVCSQIHTDRAIIFFRQKATAHRIRIVFALCNMRAAELHGSMSQEQRIQAIEAFRSGKASFLLATDLASRGLDIKGIETVINYEAPQSHEIYLHRVGRTARAGRSGKSCTLAAEPDRKVVKAAVKAGRKQGAVIRQRTIDPKDADAWQARCDALEEKIERTLREEKEEKALANTERDLTRADNIVEHRDEIMARPKKTWFVGEKDKAAARRKGAELLNGPVDGDGTAAKKDKEKGKLSNKQKKKLVDRDERREGKLWKGGKKGKPQAKSKGAVKRKK